MITREQYIEHSKKNEIPMELLLQYYNEFNQKKELNFSLESFSDIFAQFLSKYSVTLLKVREYFDRLYNITKVYNKQGAFIAIY